LKEADMAVALKPGWSKPSTILFATEFPPEEKTFSFALAEASGSGADLIIFHAYSGLDSVASKASTVCGYDYAAARAKRRLFEPLAQRARNIGIDCNIVIRPGLAADQILTFLRERKIDRVVMGAHCPGPVGKLLVGSVTEAVLRSANVASSVPTWSKVHFATLSTERSSVTSASKRSVRLWQTSARN
jgi:nucleotide-binding universal stress UspA family protein